MGSFVCYAAGDHANPFRLCTHSLFNLHSPIHNLVGVLHALQVTDQILAVCQGCCTTVYVTYQVCHLMRCRTPPGHPQQSIARVTRKLTCLLHVLQVTMQTLADSELGVSRYPIFSYDSRGGGGMAKGAHNRQHMRPCTP